MTNDIIDLKLLLFDIFICFGSWLAEYSRALKIDVGWPVGLNYNPELLIVSKNDKALGIWIVDLGIGSWVTYYGTN